jgi:solute carrier family 10 (sodium/bile acid cotransporter), member 7
MPTALKKHAFTLWLFVAVVLAVILPGPAAKGGVLHAEIVTQFGVWVIFFLQGLSLPTSELAAGYKPKRLHAFVLSWNFLLFPLLISLLLLPFSGILGPDLLLGFGLLAILPTTIISAVTFTALSGGQISNAIFSTVFSNLLAVLLVPTIAVIYLALEAAVSVPIVPLFLKLILLIVVPLILGQVLRKLAWERATRLSKKAKLVSSGIILFIVHAAFAESMHSGYLGGLSILKMGGVIGSSACILVVVSALVWWSAQWLRFDRPQQIAAFFCASQKSLATGLPLASSILLAASVPIDSAAVLLPLICYHPLQLVLAGWLTSRFWHTKKTACGLAAHRLIKGC